MDAFVHHVSAGDVWSQELNNPNNIHCILSFSKTKYSHQPFHLHIYKQEGKEFYSTLYCVLSCIQNYICIECSSKIQKKHGLTSAKLSISVSALSPDWML